MRAAVCRAFGQSLSIKEVEIDPPGPFQVAVRIEACAICHSDIAYAEGAWGGAAGSLRPRGGGAGDGARAGRARLRLGPASSRHADPRLRRPPGVCRRRPDLVRPRLGRGGEHQRHGGHRVQA